MPFYIFAWISSITYGLYAIIAKLINKYQLQNIWQFSFFSLLFGGLFISLIALLNGATVPTNWSFTILGGIFIALGAALYIGSLKNLDVSVMAPLFNIRVVITILLGYLFLGETVTLASFGLISLIAIAGFFATMDENFSIRSFFKKNVGLGLFFMLTLSIQSTLVNRAIDQTDYWTASMWMNLIAIIFAFPLFLPRFIQDFKKSKPTDYLGVFTLALLGGLGDLAANKAFSENIGISSIIISLPLSMIFVFILSIWKPSLLEKHPPKVYLVRFSAAAIMIWGALKLSV